MQKYLECMFWYNLKMFLNCVILFKIIHKSSLYDVTLHVISPRPELKCDFGCDFNWKHLNYQRVHPQIMGNLHVVWLKYTQWFYLYHTQKVISIFAHYDLDLWSHTMKINRAHPVIIGNTWPWPLTSKFKGFNKHVTVLSRHGKPCFGVHSSHLPMAFSEKFFSFSSYIQRKRRVQIIQF